MKKFCLQADALPERRCSRAVLFSISAAFKMSDMEEGELSEVEFEPEQRPKVLPSPSFPLSAERPIAVARHRLDRGQGMRITFANMSTELPVSNLMVEAAVSLRTLV